MDAWETLSALSSINDGDAWEKLNHIDRKSGICQTPDEIFNSGENILYEEQQKSVFVDDSYTIMTNDGEIIIFDGPKAIV